MSFWFCVLCDKTILQFETKCRWKQWWHPWKTRQFGSLYTHWWQELIFWLDTYTFTPNIATYYSCTRANMTLVKMCTLNNINTLVRGFLTKLLSCSSLIAFSLSLWTPKIAVIGRTALKVIKLFDHSLVHKKQIVWKTVCLFLWFKIWLCIWLSKITGFVLNWQKQVCVLGMKNQIDTQLFIQWIFIGKSFKQLWNHTTFVVRIIHIHWQVIDRRY